ncbi:hypothetical protein V8B97DRAFT_2105687 [Scleroderma yunnanense]
MTSIPTTDGPNVWSQPHYTPEQPLHLEEQCAYILQPPPNPRQIARSRPAPTQRPYNRPLPQATRFPPFTQNQFNNPSTSTFSQEEPSPFNQLNSDLNRSQWDTSSSTFGSSPTQSHSSPIFTHGSPSSDQPAYQAQYTSGFNVTNPPHPDPSTRPAVVTNGSPSGYMTPGPLQFALPQPPPRRQSELQAQYFNVMGSSHGVKRPRIQDDDDQGDPESPHEPDNATKQKPNSACSRCRGLKVRCEFLGDNDLACKRCTQAGQECVIPDRKPRRRPPKREHLLKQIREQANQIEELIAKLEQSNRHPSTSTIFHSPSDPHSPLPATSSIDNNSEAVIPKPELQDWISKARESLQTFGGLIPAASSRKDVDKGTSSDDSDNSEDDAGYDTADDNLPKVGSSPTPSTKRKDASSPPEESPYGLMAHLSIKSRQKSAEPESSDAIGVANADFFRPSPAPDPIRISQPSSGLRLPYILTHEIVKVQEVDALFEIYFKKMNPSTSLLDSKLHTPQYVAMRSPFLFTVVCAIASRFYTKRPELYAQLMHYAQLAAGTALITGTKNEEMCAAYLLMQLYPVPAKRWEEDRGWIYLGVGIRIAQDIDLNKPITSKPLNEHHARRLLSRTRIWLNCFNLDRSTGAQYGKPPIIPNTDYVARHSEQWWNSSPYNLKGFDIQLCMYNMELRLMGQFLGTIYSDPNHPMGLNKSLNFTKIASETDDALRSLGERWFHRLDEFDRESQESVFRSELLKMAFAYQRLVALSAGLKYAKTGELAESAFLERCLEAACDVVNAFVRRLFVTPEQKAYLRHAPEGQFVFVTFAGAFLVKLLLPKYAHRFSAERRKEIRTLVQEAVDLLGSEEVALDEKHAPSLYSRFLAGLLASMTADPPARPSNGNGIGANASKRPSVRARGKLREDPLLTAFQAQGAAGSQGQGTSPISTPTSGTGLVSGYSSSVRLMGSTAIPNNPATSPTSTRYSESPSPSLQTPPQDIQSFAQQQHPYQNVPSPSAVSTLPLVEGDGVMATSAGPISSSELFHTPMPIDADLLESMQFMADPVWQDTAVQGFNWMNQFDAAASSNDYVLFAHGSSRY